MLGFIIKTFMIYKFSTRKVVKTKSKYVQGGRFYLGMQGVKIIESNTCHFFETNSWGI